MRLSVGILAWNEQDAIGRTLRSLFEQELFRPEAPLESLEVVVIPNGCRDRTAQVAAEVIAAALPGAGAHVVARVEELQRAGKSHAWNEFVHRLSDPRADYLALVDADIVLGSPHVLSRLLKRLEEDRRALVASALPIKDPRSLPKNGLVARLSRSASAAGRAGPAGVCGMLYCGRAEALRRVYLPNSLLVEDGFLRAMIATELFARPEELERVVRVDEAEIYFEAEQTVASIFRHELRICSGSLVNFIAFAELERVGAHGDVGQYVRELNERNPEWLAELIAKHAAQRYWLVPTPWLFRRIRRAREAAQTWRRLPFLVVATGFDWVVAVVSNQRLHAGILRW